MSFLETITFTDVLCRQARTTKQKDWLHEIEQTAKYDCNFHDFLSDILLASNLCFQIQKNSSQVTDGLKQFSDLHLWVKLKHFSFLCLVPPEMGDIWVLNSLIKVQKRLQTYTRISEYTGKSKLMQMRILTVWWIQKMQSQEKKYKILNYNAFIFIFIIFYFFLTMHLKCDWNITTFCVTPPGI